jgi:predicted component of viral defense system (DUF524 family)
LKISIHHIADDLSLNILPVREDYVCHIVEDAYQNGESPYQIAEGQFYQYSFSNDNYGFQKNETIEPFIDRGYLGRISPNIYVGTLPLSIIDLTSEKIVGSISLEVQSIKTSYREDYRFMLEEITEQCTELLMQINSPVQQSYEVDFGKDNKTDYQRFAFVNSLINSDNFNEAISRIVTSPTTKWIEETELVDIRKVRRLNQRNLRQILSRSNRTKIPSTHNLRNYGITSVPLKIENSIKSDSVDTTENRFVKHALEVFLKFSMDFHASVATNTRESAEAYALISKLEEHLGNNLFKSVSRPSTLKLNSPVLQRKEGYREVLKSWLIFDLAAKLIWEGGEDIYSAGKRDIATLYEYWLFFKLLNLFSDVFNIENKDVDELIKPTNDGLGLQLKQGRHTALQGIYKSGSRNLQIRFSYNREFSGAQDYPKKGSWTKSMKPDYTLSIWPDGVSENEAEEQELITHVHFDAKYKIDNLRQIIDTEENPDTEKKDQAKGKYKNADLLKMHAYRDSIRRTSGAYVLYPGHEVYRREGFHEIIPGLGAFPVRPSRSNSGISQLKQFVLEIVNHSLNRASQKEKISLKQYQVYKDKPSGEVKEAIPEAYGNNRSTHPDETMVLIAYFKNQEHFDWIIKEKLYNARLNSDRGSIRLNPDITGSKYILLHTKGDKSSARIFQINEEGPRIFTKAELIKKRYNGPSQEAYLVFKISEVNLNDFDNAQWDFKRLSGYKTGQGSSLPFVASLSELMTVKNKPE